MSKSREIKLDKNYKPLPTYEGDEIYPNGIFNFSGSLYDVIDKENEYYILIDRVQLAFSVIAGGVHFLAEIRCFLAIFRHSRI